MGLSDTPIARARLGTEIGLGTAEGLRVFAFLRNDLVGMNACSHVCSLFSPEVRVLGVQMMCISGS